MLSRSTGAAGVAASILAASLLVVVAVALPLGPAEGPPSSMPSSPFAAEGASTPPRLASPTQRAARIEAARPPSQTPAPATGLDVGWLAPDFELRTPEDEPVRLSGFRGRPVWINFWAPWCPACRTEMPRLERLYAQHQADGLVILGVGVRDSPESLRTYAGEVGVTYPIVVDGDGAIANLYQALALPVHYWIDRDGIVRDWAFGELPPDLLASSLRLVLQPSDQ